MKKVLFILTLCIACFSLFLPFQEYKSMWADFDPSGMLSDLDPDFNENLVNRGYELILPYFSIGLLLLGAFLLLILKSQWAKVIAAVVGILNVLYVLYLYIVLISPVERLPNSITSPPLPMIGMGYFVLLISVIAAAFLSISLVRASKS